MTDELLLENEDFLDMENGNPLEEEGGDTPPPTPAPSGSIRFRSAAGYIEGMERFGGAW